MTHLRSLVVTAAVAIAPAAAHADGTVAITLTQDGQDLAAALGIDPAELAAQVEAEVDEAYRINRVDEFLRAFADATAFSGRGIGVDYASNGDGLMFGLTANVAAAVGDLGQGEREAEHPVAGVAPNLAVMGGLNFARWNRPALTVYANAFYRGGTIRELTGSIASLGVHAQYKLFDKTEGKKALVVQWGGLTLTGGLEMSRWAFALDSGDRIETQQMTVDGTSGSTDVAMTARGTFELDATSVVAPVEATTAIRFLYFVSLYGGASLAFQAGRTTLDAELDADLTATDPQDGSVRDIGAAAITIDGDRAPSPGKITFLGGVQVNVWKLKTFVQANFMPVRAASVAFGLRVVL